MSKSLYPPGATNANWFSAVNALCFQITLGAPMILYAKSLGATATVLGVIASMTPLLTIMQIPAARFLTEVGYRRFMMGGWGLRTLCIFLLGLVPLIPFLGDLGKIALVLFVLFIFNLLRGISTSAWLPWITDLIPENVRGRFLSRDQMCIHLGSLASLLLAAVVLRGKAEPREFAFLFLVSALAGAGSLVFLNRIPDVDAHDTAIKSKMRVPWRAIMTYPPFLRLIIFTVLYVFTLGSAGVFGVAFLKSGLHLSESEVLSLSVVFFMGALATMPISGRLVEHTGSRPILQGSLAVMFGIFVTWWLIAGHVIHAPSFLLLAVLHFIGGIAGANFNLAHVRLVMSTMPLMGRSHFFAFFSVISSLGLGISPLVWGVFIDGIGEHEHLAAGLNWNRYSDFYFGLLLCLAGTAAFTGLLQEKMETRQRIDPKEMLFSAKLKRLLRFGSDRF